jgi:GR25 family glycosyltransferase involved in LPS biosynthesis
MLLVWVMLFLSISVLAEKCSYTQPNSLIPQPEVFWINMDKSEKRKDSMELHLRDTGMPNRRVKGLRLEDIYFPEDILSSWDKYLSLTQTTLKIPHRNVTRKIPMQTKHVMLGLVGRGGKNKLKEVGCTSSHLEAMRQAIYDNSTNSRYAVIAEDDIFFPFNIDFNALAAAAPAGFGILQLFNSNEESMESQWMRFVKKGELWAESYQRQPASFWSTCAYLIDREVMKPIIDKIAYKKNGWINLKIVAGIKTPCRPKVSECCSFQNDTMTFKFSHIPPCIWAAKGYQADSFIYALTKTYVLTVPLITNGENSNRSTFHQEHVQQIHKSAFARQRSYINELIAQKYALPNFATKACNTPLMIVAPDPPAPPSPPQVTAQKAL